MTNQPPPPGYNAPPPGYNPGAGGEHPKGQTLLVTSIIALLCCAPVNIWVLITANGIQANPGGYDVSKVNTARIIAIVSLVLWAVGIVLNFAMGNFAALMGQP